MRGLNGFLFIWAFFEISLSHALDSEKYYSIKKTIGYDPVFYTLAATLESRDYPAPDRITQILLPWIGPQTSSQNFEKPIPAFWQKSEHLPKTHLIIVLGASFSTWKRGTWFRKTHMMGPNNYDYLFVPGFFTPDAIQLKPKILDFTQRIIAQDLYKRISDFLAQNSSYTKVGLVGFSGGANLALELLLLDGKQQKSRLNGGAYLASPILDLNSTLANLEKKHNQAIAAKVITANDALTNQSFVANQVAEKTWLRVSGKYEADYLRVLRIGENPETKQHIQWKARFYNEFWSVDYGYLKNQTDVPVESVVSMFTENLISTVSKITVPVYVVFALDDPILGGENSEFILNQFARNENVRIFSPRQGGHLGFILDSHFYELSLKEFFNSQP